MVAAYVTVTILGAVFNGAAAVTYLIGHEYPKTQMFGRLFNLSAMAARSRANELPERFDLAGAGDHRVGTYSGGMRRRLDLAGPHRRTPARACSPTRPYEPPGPDQALVELLQSS